MNLFAQIRKVDAVHGLVYGRIAEEIPDSSGEIMDYEKSKPHFQKWSQEFSDATDGASVGNVRAMHGNVAAGKLTEITFLDDQKAIDVTAKIVDANEFEKCKEGVYTGFSIGGKYGDRWQDGLNKRYVGIPNEVSLVDSPCLKTARFSLIKGEGLEPEEREFKSVIDLEKKQKELAELQKAEISYKLKKYAMEEIYDVASATDALRIIAHLFISESQEDKPESSEQTASLKACIENLKNFIASEIKETDTEAIMQMSERIGNLAKSGARNSKGDLEKIQAIHDHSVSLGAACKAEKFEVTDDLLKIEGFSKESTFDETITKVIFLNAENQALRKSIKEQEEKIKKLEDTPEPGKGVVKSVTVTKADDTGEQREIEKEPKTAKDAIKKVLAGGGVPLKKFNG